MDPDAVDLTDLSLFLREDHHEVFAGLRRQDPVHWQEPAGGRSGFWSLTRHADVVAVNRDADTFVSGRGFTMSELGPPERPPGAGSGMLVALDGELHHHMRRMVSRGFTPRAIGLLEAHLAERARTIVAGVADRGACDFVADVAAELPLEAIADLLGIPAGDRARIFVWGNRLVGFDDPEYGGDRERQLQTIGEMFAYAAELRAARQADPRDDLVTQLTTAEVDGEALSDIEFGEFFLLLAVAGNETTRNAAAHGVRALARDPDQLRALAADPAPGPMGRAVEEVLRWASPVLHFRRTAARETEIGGRRIHEGDRVVMWYVSANRDEAVFADPFRFDIDRHPNDHVAFGGGGPHFCLGASLARLELRLLLTEIVTRLPGLRLDGPAELLRSNFVGGIKRLPVAWTT